MTVGWDDEFVVLPDTTNDESAAGWGDETADDDDGRLLEDRPPHWD